MNLQVADMISNTGIALHSLEKEFIFTVSLQPSKRKPEYWQNLGSSKARTAIGHLLLGWEAKIHKATINEIRSNIKN